MPTTSIERVKVADEVWIAAALLHREHATQPDFAVDEIVARAAEESIVGTVRPGLYVHVVQHCVANRAPNPARYRMLFETAPGRRRLFRPGDSYDPKRERSKTTPSADQLPAAYSHLLAWYAEWCSAALSSAPENDALLRLAGSGRHLWAGEHADEYVNRLRDERE